MDLPCSVTTKTCGVSSSSSTRRTRMNRMWNGFLGSVMRNLGRQNDLIYGGSPATITEAPFMAFLRTTHIDGTVWNCGASIISESLVLTAAHCVIDENNQRAASVAVTVGSADSSVASTQVAASFTYDTAFDINNLGNGHDIALVRLATPLVFTPSIQPICFPTSDSVLGKAISSCDQKAYGWGYINSAGTTQTTTLQKLDVTVSSSVSSCSSLTDESIICVQGDAPNSGICQGDSGGPLVVRYNGRAYVTGITSFTVGKCSTGISGYTRTSKYAAWLQQQITG
ncbi:unnamed protein product [Darwinula stevensoni]|uniref:Peptidase S1 domain-containing protein n=1 Tax=Darwinula stevensoni TaxID=69355 RepID=A0A7R9ABP0_9CRUS|nr:unnamed protein product [Darwinula stevensoni]CAG0899478.1 unnamed protein product [Darwinula stevensoni]